MVKKILAALFCSAALCASAAEIQPEIFGKYAAGCIRGAVPLENGEHYQVQIWGQGRNYGHPELISYIKDLVKRAREAGLPDLLIGDLSLRYGGPFGAKSSHGSHNVGLDVDISFDFATPKKTQYELSHPEDVYLVTAKNKVTENFTPERVTLIRLAAEDERVERIFVAPGIKRELCRVTEGEERGWLRKIRPWFGHRGHMHVRIGCPLDSPQCVSQAAPPSGDGCGAELASWFQPPKPVKSGEKPKPRPKKVLPAACKAVLQGF